LLVGEDGDDDLEAMVGDEEVFQIVRGSISPTELRKLIDKATRKARLLALSESANDQAANPDEPVSQHIVMETSENGSTIISDGTGRVPALKPEKVSLTANIGGNQVDVLVLTQDDEFLATIRDSARGLHNVHHANTPVQAEGFLKGNSVGVLVTDAAMVGSSIEDLTQSLRKSVPRLVAVVAGRRDDGELLMDLINRGHVYRFLLKPVSPGRARLAIEASVKHHLEAGDSAFKCKPKPATRPAPARKAAAKPPMRKKPAMKARLKPKPQAKPKGKPPAKPKPTRASPPRPASTVITASPEADRLSDPFDNESAFGETMTGIASSVGKSLSGASGLITGGAKTALKSSGSGLVKLLAVIVAPLIRPKNIAIVGSLLAIVGGGYWLTNNWQSLLPQSQPEGDSGMPVIVESDVPSEGSQTPVVSAVDDLLDEARSARGSGYIYSPAGANAVEFYLAAMSLDPDDPIIAAELEDVVDQALGMIEKALLQQRTDDAAEALQMVRLADPDNSRLVFLDTQVRQMQLRNALDQARAAIRGG
jgi:DNA-binding NarL/FixJ family response regulator